MSIKSMMATLDIENLTIDQKNIILREFEKKYDVYFEWYADETTHIYTCADLWLDIGLILALCCGDYSFEDIYDRYWEKVGN